MNSHNMDMRYDQIVIVDVEATCWKGPPPPGEQSEIIEIGICLLDVETLEPSNKRSLLVKPVRSTVSDFCTELTTLTQAHVSTGMPFAEACALMERDYISQERVWGSWGSFDRKMFAAQCASFHVRYPFSERHLNLKRMFAGLHRQRQVGMVKALEISKLPLVGTHHRGDDDAWNIACLLRAMLRQHSQDVLRRYW